MRYFTVAVFMLACGSDPVALKGQSFDDLENWGLGIEGFNPNSTAPIDTGGSSSGFTQYDGAYFGTYQLAVSYAGENCSFSDVSLIINIVNGDITGSGQPGTTNCGNIAELSFDGTVGADTIASGMLYEETGFIFESNWSGYVVSATDLLQISGSFNESVTTINPGGLVTVSGSFIAEQ
jgi:hypothetical protein